MQLEGYSRRWLSPAISYVNCLPFIPPTSVSLLTTRLYLLFGLGMPGLPPIGGVLEPLAPIAGR